MKIKNLTKTYETKNGVSVRALNDVSLDLPDKGMVFILGKSGSGKSTLLKLLSGMDSPNSGEIEFHGKKLSQFEPKELDYYRSTYCGMVFQEYNLLSEFNVFDNVSLALEMQGIRKTKRDVQNVLDMVEMSGYEKRKLTELSGGQRQRVAIARAIVKKPEIIFADEPTGALDSETSKNIFSIFKKLSQNRLIIVVTHEKEYAEEYGDRIIELFDGKVINDTIKREHETTIKSFRTKKTRLPFRTAIKIGGSIFRRHPIQLTFILLVSILAFTLFEFVVAFSLSNSNQAAVDSIYKAKLEYSLVRKTNGDGERCAINEADIGKLSVEYQTDILRIVEGDFSINELTNAQLSPYYSVQPYGAALVNENEAAPFAITNFGDFPNNENEVMITKFTANQLIVAGKASSYNALLGMAITVMDQEYIISGVIDTNFPDNKYEQIKEAVFNREKKQLLNQYYQEIRKSPHNIVFLSRTAFLKLQEEIDYTSIMVNLKGLSKNQLKSIFSVSTSEYIFNMDNVVLDEITEIMSEVENYSTLLFILSGIFGILAVLFLSYFISQGIEDKKTTIGVLKTIGISDMEISKIFFGQSVTIGAIVSISCLLISFIVCAILNAVISPIGNLAIFGIDFLDIILLFVTVGVGSGLGYLIPTRKIKKANPTKIIGS